MLKKKHIFQHHFFSIFGGFGFRFLKTYTKSTMFRTFFENMGRKYCENLTCFEKMALGWLLKPNCQVKASYIDPLILKFHSNPNFSLEISAQIVFFGKTLLFVFTLQKISSKENSDFLISFFLIFVLLCGRHKCVLS